MVVIQSLSKGTKTSSTGNNNPKDQQDIEPNTLVLLKQKVFRTTDLSFLRRNDLEAMIKDGKITRENADAFLKEAEELKSILSKLTFDPKSEENIVETARQKDFRYFTIPEIKNLAHLQKMECLRKVSADVGDLFIEHDLQNDFEARLQVKNNEDDIIAEMAKRDTRARGQFAYEVKDRQKYIDLGKKHFGLTEEQVNKALDHVESLEWAMLWPVGVCTVKKLPPNQAFVVSLTTEQKQNLKIEDEVLNSLKQELGPHCDLEKADKLAEALINQGKLSRASYLRFREEFSYVGGKLGDKEFYEDEKNLENLLKESKDFTFCTEDDIKKLARAFLIKFISPADDFKADAFAGRVIEKYKLLDDPEVRKIIAGRELNIIYRMAREEMNKEAMQGIGKTLSTTKVQDRKIYIELGKKFGLTEAQINKKLDEAEKLHTRMRFPIGKVGDILNKIF